MRLSIAFVALCLAACGPITDDPYESCVPGDTCTQGTQCLATTLPVSTGYTGDLCTVVCAVAGDCPQDITNYAAICVNQQCYTQCPNGSISCPYGTTCITFSDQNNNAVNICTP